MATKKKTEEELQLATHNRLKGTICYHMSSAISQTMCINKMLQKYREGCELQTDKIDIDSLQSSILHIRSALKSFDTLTRSRLSIGESPSSIRNYKPRKNRKPYAAS